MYEDIAMSLTNQGMGGGGMLQPPGQAPQVLPQPQPGLQMPGMPQPPQPQQQQQPMGGMPGAMPPMGGMSGAMPMQQQPMLGGIGTGLGGMPGTQGPMR